jgi:hypothetical protein
MLKKLNKMLTEVVRGSIIEIGKKVGSIIEIGKKVGGKKLELYEA